MRRIVNLIESTLSCLCYFEKNGGSSPVLFLRGAARDTTASLYNFLAIFQRASLRVIASSRRSVAISLRLAWAVAVGARPFADAGCLTLGPSGRGLVADRGPDGAGKIGTPPNLAGRRRDYVRRAARPTSSKRVIYPWLRNVRAHGRRFSF